MKLCLTLLAGIIASASVFAGEIIRTGGEFTAESKNASQEDGGGLIAGNFTYGAAVYEFPLPAGIDQAKFRAEFENRHDKWIKLYAWNHGAAADGDAVRNKNLDGHWRLWEATDGSGTWESKSPEYLYLSSGDGRIDFLGPERILKLLFYADPGIPFINDGRFLIKSVKLLFSDTTVADTGKIPDSASVRDRIVTSENAWIEGDLLLVKGVGVPNPSPNVPEASRKAMTARAAKVVAYKNLVIALGKINPAGGTAQIPGTKVRDTKYHEDGSVEVILEVPLDKLQ